MHYRGNAKMTRICLVGLGIVLSLQLAFAKDFHKKYTLAPGGQIVIANFLGDVRVRGSNRTDIEIIGKKKGADRDKLEILDNSAENRVEIRLRPGPPEGSDARVDFEVRVPKAVEYNYRRISSFSGNVDISGITGWLRAESIRGSVTLADVKGLVSATSFSGSIKAAIDNVQDRGNIRFSSISGNIDVTAPSNLDALIDISCASGMLKTDFPLQIEELRYGPGRSARGRLGKGKMILHMRSVTGRVSLTHM